MRAALWWQDDADLPANRGGMAAPEAFYEPIDDSRYVPTEATTSPWDERMQHGGPPTALAVHVLNRAQPRPEMRMAQVVVHFLGAIPRTEMVARVEIERPGRRIELSRITLSAGDRAVVAASVWRIAARSDIPVPQGVLERDAQAAIPPLPDAQIPQTFEGLAGWGYFEAIEWRFARGGFRTLGPAQLWTRLRIPLVAGRVTEGVERIATVADSANGVSREFELDRYLFVPTSLAITLDRHPAGEWTYLGATTHVGPEGLGFTSSTLGDARGPVGVASQTLIFEPGPGARFQGGAAPTA
jgi:hypothetical protein